MNDATQFNIPCGQRQLFLDDVGIERIENLTRTLHQPSKRGAVVRSANPTQTIQTRTAPTWDPEESGLQVLGYRDGRRLPHQRGWAALDVRPQTKHWGDDGGS